jgi:hypothetical protein
MDSKRMTKTKEKEKIEVVRINPVNDETDEVFLYRDTEGLPYVNEAVYVPKGTYKLGAFTEETVEKKKPEEG